MILLSSNQPQINALSKSCCTSISKLSTGYICLRLSPKIITHSPPLSITVDLQTTRCKGGRGIVTLDKPQLTIAGSCRFIDRYILLYYMHGLSIISTVKLRGWEVWCVWGVPVVSGSPIFALKYLVHALYISICPPPPTHTHTHTHLKYLKFFHH